MRPIRRIIIHCSYTCPDMNIGAEEITRWHVEENNWRTIGYHGVIRRNGGFEPGRPIVQAGAHAGPQHNHDSIAICMVGGARRQGKLLFPDCNFTADQWLALTSQVMQLLRDYPTITAIQGHRDVAARECPTFDAIAWGSSFLGP